MASVKCLYKLSCTKQNIRVLGGKLFVNKTEAEHKGVGGQVICQ